MNLTDKLARRRNRDAAERTLMAWIRTCLSLIGFGFGLDKIVAAISSRNLQRLLRDDVTDQEEPSIASTTAVMITLIGLAALLLLVLGGMGR